MRRGWLAAAAALAIPGCASTPVIVTGAAFLAGAGLIAHQAHEERQIDAARVAYFTAHGTKVVKSPAGLAPPRELVEPAIEQSAVFWCDRRPPADCAAMRAALGRATLGFTDEPLVRYAGQPMQARGLTVGVAMMVSQAWPAPTVAALVSHEAGHVELGAVGVPDADQHAVMAAAGFPY